MFAMGKWFWSGHGLAVVVPGTWMRIVHNDLVYMVEVPHYAPVAASNLATPHRPAV